MSNGSFDKQNIINLPIPNGCLYGFVLLCRLIFIIFSIFFQFADL